MNEILGLLESDRIIKFIIVVIGIAIYFIIKQNKNKVNVMCSIMISLGMLGTFAGIAKGLSNFDTANIAQSIPSLLEGMKMAFNTSIAGMMGSIVIKILSNIFIKEKEEIESIDHLFIQMIEEIKKLNKNIDSEKEQTEEVMEDIVEFFEETKKSFCDAIENLNKNLSEKQDVLINEFRSFGESMAHNNTQALINVLENVISDFNNNLTEQFGENFKELNSAVEKLVGWQEEYKENIILTTGQLKETVGLIKNVENSFINIEKGAIGLKAISENIANSLSELNDTQNKVEKGLNGINGMAENAENSIEHINEYIKSVSSGMFTECEKMINKINGSLLDVNKEYKTLIENVEATNDNTNKVLKASIEQIKGQSNCLEETNKELRERLQIQITEIHEEASKGIVATTEQMQDVLRQRSEQVGKMLEDELKESLNSLGTQLATLSNRFVEDYTPLTEKLRDVVRIAEDI